MRQPPPSTPRRILFAAAAAVVAGLGALSLLAGFSSSWPLRVAEGIAVFGLGTVVLGGAVVLALVRLGGWRESDEEFERLVRRTEQLAAADSWGEGDDDLDGFDDPEPEEHPAFRDFDVPARLPEHAAFRNLDTPARRSEPTAPPDFEAVVRSAVGQLPIEFHLALEHVAIVVEDGGSTVGSGSAPSTPGRRRDTYARYVGDPVAHDYFHDRIVIFRDPLVRDFGDDPDRLRDAVAQTVRDQLARRV